MDLNFVGPVLKIGKNLVERFAGVVGETVTSVAAGADRNPKTALVTAASMYFGVQPQHLVWAGKTISNLGLVVVKFGQAMGG